jgi:hypothetical protein
VRGTINERRWKSLSTGSLTRRTVNLIQGVTMVKPKSSRYGTFRLYATPKFQDRNEARNDFVLVQAKNSTALVKFFRSFKTKFLFQDSSRLEMILNCLEPCLERSIKL